MRIVVTQAKNYGATKSYMKKLESGLPSEDTLNIVANNTINKLKAASPNEEISKGWSYEIIRDKKHISLYFNNSAISKNGENLAILIDNGHATKDGFWIAGTHFTKEPLEDAYKEIFEKTREELRKL